MGALNREVRGLHEAAYLLAIFSLLSQVLAILRDRLLAHVFGASGSLDIYYAAFRIPDVLFVTVASLFSFSVLVPFLQTALARGEQEARNFMGSVFLAFTALMVISALIAFVSVPYIMPHLFPGFVGGAKEHTLIVLTRILLLQPILLGFSGLLASISQVYHRFVLYAISPVLYNAGIICGVIFFYPIWGLYGIGLGVVLGALLHALVQVPFVHAQAFFSRTCISAWVEVRTLCVHSLPRTLALSLGQLVLLVFAGIASSLGEGMLAAFTFAFNLASVPLSIIATSYTTAAFPTLSKLHTEGNSQGFCAELILASRHLIFWTVPAVVFLVVLRAHVVRVLLGTGAFNWDDTRLVAAGLALFVCSLVAQALTLLYMRALYALGKTRLPLMLASATAILAILFGFWFTSLATAADPLWRSLMTLLRVVDVHGTAMLALPLAFSCAHLCGVVLTVLYLERVQGQLFSPLLRSLRDNLIASLGAGVMVWVVLQFWGQSFTPDTLVSVLLQGTTAGCAGLFVWVFTLSLLKSKELSETFSMFRRTFWRQAPIAPNEETVL